MTEPADTTAAAPEAAPSSRRGRLLAAGAAGTFAALVGGAAFAYSMLAGGGAQPADVMPSTTQAYARLDLDPSASQKIALFRLLRQIPDAAQELDDAEDVDLRRLALEDLLGDMCADLDYEADVEPWLGQRIGIGANFTDEQVLVAAQVTDEAAARQGLDSLADCGDQKIGLAFVDGFALISDSQQTVDAAITANAKGTLGEHEDFIEDMDALGEHGIASAWFDGDAMGDALADSGLAPAELAELKEIGNVGSGAFALRVAGSAIELAGVSDATDDTQVDPAPIGDLPADTVLAMSLSGLGPRVGEQFDTLRDAIEGELDDFLGGPGVAPEPLDPELLEGLDAETREFYEDLLTEQQAPPLTLDEQLDSFESETGLALPDDLATLLGNTFTLAVGRANLESIPVLQGPDDLAELDLAVRTQGDPAETVAVMDDLVALAEGVGVRLVSEQTQDGAVLATNPEAARALLDGGKLGDSDRYRSVMPYGDDTLQGMFLDVSAVIDAALASDPPADVLADLAQVEAISGVGVSAGQLTEDRIGFSFRVAFGD